MQASDADHVRLELGQPLRADLLGVDAGRAGPALELVEPGNSSRVWRRPPCRCARTRFPARRSRATAGPRIPAPTTTTSARRSIGRRGA
jgi:hypothetical protein